MKQIYCPGCGGENAAEAIYCKGCGERIGAGTCQCGATLPPLSHFCPTCGRDTDVTAAADMGRRAPHRREAGIRWVRDDQEVAARITPSDLKGRLASGLEVQPGTRALLFLGGRYVGTLSPGRHTVENLWQKLKIPTDGEPVAVVVDDGELGLEFSVGGLHTADNHNAVLQAQASLRLAEPEVFLVNLMRDQSNYTVADLAVFLGEEIRQSLSELLAGHNAEDLYRGRVRAEMEMELLSRWKATLDRTGFALNRFRVLRFELPGLEKAEDVRSDTGDAVTVLEAGREGRAAFFEQELSDFRLDTDQFFRLGVAEGERREAEIGLEISRMQRETKRLEDRQPVLERLLQGGVLERMAELKSEEEWRKFRLQVDKDRLLSDNEWDELRKDTAAEAAEAEVRRQFVFKRLQAVAQAELDELVTKRTYQLKLLEMQGDTAVVAEEIRKDQQLLDAELVKQQKRFTEKLRQRQDWFDQIKSEKKSKADIQMYKIERMEAVRQMAKDKDSARRLQEQVTLAEIERKRFEKEAEMMGMMTAEQIMASAVARNPGQAAEIAKAFDAMNAGKASARERELYERMLSEVKGAYQKAQTLDHEKFKESVAADVRHRTRRESLDEQEKDRLEGVAVAGLTADDKKRIVWQWCELHQLKYQSGRPCPMCTQEKKSDQV